MIVEHEDGTWHVLVDSAAYPSRAAALDGVVASLPADSPSPLLVDICAMPDRVAKPTIHHFKAPAPEPTHEVKAKNLRVGYEVKAAGAPAWSRISEVERDDQAGGMVAATLPWGTTVFGPDELVEVKAEVLHPRIVDDKGAEIGVGSMIKGGDSDAGELVELVEPDESHWGVLVKWPEFDEPERFEASPNDPSEDPLYCTDVEAI